jgi:hypothetical protein
MRELTDMGVRVIVAMFAGAGLVALIALLSGLLPSGGLADALGGWPLLVALAALLCGVCALGMSVGLCLRRGARLVGVTLVASAAAWGVCLSAGGSRADWTLALAGAPPLAHAVAPLAAIGASMVAWLLLFVGLAGALAGRRREASATQRTLTPLWLTPLWGAGVGVVYGLLFAAVYVSPCFPGPPHCFGLDISRWDALRIGLALGAGGGVILGLILALALRLALIVRPALAEWSPLTPQHVAVTHRSEA